MKVKPTNPTVKNEIMNHNKVQDALRSIGLALNASNNTIATDDVTAKIGPNSWRIDHSSELKNLEYLEQLLNNSETCPLCGNRNNDL